MLNNFNISVLFCSKFVFSDSLINHGNAIKDARSVFTWALKQFGG